MPFDPMSSKTEAQIRWAAAHAALADLADYLPSIPDSHWHFEEWVLKGFLDRVSEGKSICGTVGCAIGHGIASVPKVRALLELSANNRPCGKLGEPAHQALGMPVDDFCDVFTMEGYGGSYGGRVPTQHQVARKLRAYLADHPA